MKYFLIGKERMEYELENNYFGLTRKEFTPSLDWYIEDNKLYIFLSTTRCAYVYIQDLIVDTIITPNINRAMSPSKRIMGVYEPEDNDDLVDVDELMQDFEDVYGDN